MNYKNLIIKILDKAYFENEKEPHLVVWLDDVLKILKEEMMLESNSKRVE